jgi:uroporphyrin-III C-methyltransferase/precorrin-2 dehydrogenase/sirohydrochlorin ferrochelatase/uroporphyrin-III C-methyltransferase
LEIGVKREAQVFLVGAGPGDPELLTLKAHRLIQEADVVVYDRLVSDAILDLVPAGTAKIYAGKATKCRAMPQDEINELLAKVAQAGHRVVRLKGGDPYTFGRGSEEAEHLARCGIAFEVVPGITSASGCSAAAGIPLTHRGLASGVTLVTGHARDDRSLDLDWHRLADPDQTLAVYMGLAMLPKISAELIAAGLAPSTPAAAIASGTTAKQRVCIGTLTDLAERARAQDLQPPVLILIGRVVGLSAVLAPTATAEAHDAEERRHVAI